MDTQTEMNQMYGQLGISAQVLEYGRRVEETLKERFEAIDRTAEYNQMKVIKGIGITVINNARRTLCQMPVKLL